MPVRLRLGVQRAVGLYRHFGLPLAPYLGVFPSVFVPLAVPLYKPVEPLRHVAPHIGGFNPPHRLVRFGHSSCVPRYAKFELVRMVRRLVIAVVGLHHYPPLPLAPPLPLPPLVLRYLPPLNGLRQFKPLVPPPPYPFSTPNIAP